MSDVTQDPRSALLGVYRVPDILFVRGEGTELIDDGGRRYLDFTTGIGVNALGHGHPVVIEALERAVSTGLIHVSNLFRTSPGEELARRLTELSGRDRVFFTNSGAEAVEGSLKFARRWARGIGGGEKHRIVALQGSFHGRLFGSLALTWRRDHREPFEPLMPGVDFADPTDPDSIERLLDPERTAAVIAEPIQGEGGVRPLDDTLLQRIRDWTRERRIALILDEIQCGFGRTGTFLAHESAGISPDLVCVAKPIAGGLPMGAVLMSEEVASAINPGEHGTTFGGGPFVSTVALAVLEVLSDPEFLASVREKGAVLEGLLEELREHRPERVREIRGRGLFRGIELTGEAAPVIAAARAEGLLTVPAGTDVIRFLPPLTVSEEELRRGVKILEAGLS